MALQLLQRRQSLGEDLPLLVVGTDAPGAPVLECNAVATQMGVSVGMRYSEALSLSETIRAGVVTSDQRESAVREIRLLLEQFLPSVEVWSLLDTVFWGDVRGMDRLGAGTDRWVRRLVVTLEKAGWRGGIAFGWTRPGTFFAATEELSSRRTLTGAESRGPGVHRFHREEEEIRWLQTRRVDRLPLLRRDRQRLSLLGIRRVSDLLAIQEEGLRRRFTDGFQQLYRFLKADADTVPAQSSAGKEEVIHLSARYEPSLRRESDLIQGWITLVEGTIPTITEQGVWIRTVHLSCTDDEGRIYRETLDCGRLTRDSAYIGRLIGLRLEERRWRVREVVGASVAVMTEEATVRQGSLGELLEDGEGDRSREMVEETIALIRARLGDDNVFQLALRAGRVPEHRFGKRALAIDGRMFRKSTLCRMSSLVLIRRVPIGGPAPFGGAVPPVRYGPFVQSPEWWDGDDSDRVYTYHRDRTGKILWLYRTVQRGPWMVQGCLG